MGQKHSKLLKRTLKAVIIILLMIVALPWLLYVPPVQKFVKDIVVNQINKSTDFTVSVDRILLRFPLDLNVDKVLVLDEHKDTMIYADNLAADVKLLPLFRLKMDIGRATLIQGVYRMASKDSSMLIAARAKQCEANKVLINFNSNGISVDNATLRNGTVKLLYYPEKVKPSPADTVKSKGWHITARHLALRQIAYSMQMLPYIDNLNATLASATLEDGIVDTEKCIAHARALKVEKINARYIYPTPQYIAKHPLKPDTIPGNSPDTTQWTVTGDLISLSDSHAVYAMKGAKAQPGLDMNYLEGIGINFEVQKFFNRGKTVTVPLSKFSASERCGLKITGATGTFAMDSTVMQASHFNISTILSSIRLDGKVAMSFFDNDKAAPLKLNLQASVGIGEIGKLYPSLRPLLKGIPQYSPLEANIDVQGTASVVNIRKANLRLPKYASATITGRALYPMNPKRTNADIAFRGQLDNVNFAKPALLSASLQKEVNLPSVSIKGNVNYTPSDVKGDLSMRLSSGKLVLAGNWNGTRKAYSTKLSLDSFPIHAILPLSAFGSTSLSLQARGRGFDPYDKHTAFNGNINIARLDYNREVYCDVSADAQLNDGKFNVKILSANEFCDMNLNASGILKKKYYQFDLYSDINYIDLKALKFSDAESRGQGQIIAYGEIDLRTQDYDVALDLKNFNWMLPGKVYFSPQVNASLVSNSGSIAAMIEDNDFKLLFNSQCSVDSFIYKLNKCQQIAMSEYKSKSLNIDTLQTNLPNFSCDVSIGTNNLLQQYLKASDIKFKKISFSIDNDSTIYMRGKAEKVKFSDIQIDTITVFADEKEKKLQYALHIGNAKGTNDAFASVSLSGDIFGNKLSALLSQKNIKGETGFDFGVNAMLTDSLVNLDFFPKQPTIGYRKWTVNDSNNLAYYYNSHRINANLELQSDSSTIALKSATDGSDNQENLLLKIAQVQIGEWLNLSPFAPPVNGVLGADMKLKYDGKNFWGDGTTSIDNLTYAGKRVGDFKLNMLLDLNPVKNCVTLTSNMDVNGKCAITAAGVLNDTAAVNPMMVVMELDSFPLSTMTPFIPQGMAQLSGYLSGLTTISGTTDEPLINGYLKCDSAMVYMPVFGSRLYFPDTKLAVDSSIVKFDQYAIKGSNKNAIVINGLTDLHRIDNPSVNLSLRGNNVEFVNSKQNRKSEVFGKGYANIDATVTGKMNNLYTNANVSILSGTNLTYVMQTDVSTMSPQTNEGMVKFVNFTDSTLLDTDSVAIKETLSSFAFNASLNIQQGAKLNVFLSTDGKNRVQIEGNGNLNFSQSAFGDLRLTGRYTIGNGFVRYSPPLLSEKLFNFNSGSYVAWTGDLMNPILNLSAVETLRANVTQEGQDSRLIDFLISLSVTNSFSNMAIDFDLNTNDDLTVQNELQSMSPSQRSSQAINLLLYNTYTGPGTSSTGNLSGNPLYSFINSQLNQWAANTIKGIDLSLGINQYDETRSGTTSKTTSYSYKISKSLFNDRFKIVVGGNYNPNETSDENIALDLLNDISFEYKLNKSGSMYVRLFRHTGYESILEGEITEMGAGFVIKRKLSTLKRLFSFRRRKPSAFISVDSIRLIPTKERTTINTKK